MIPASLKTAFALLSNKYWFGIAIALLLILGISWLGWLIVGAPILVLTITLLFGLLLLFQLLLSARLLDALNSPNAGYYQVESLFSLISLLKIRYPLPPMRGWAISPDFAKTLASLILEIKPRLIVELGSGTSSIISAYCLEQLNEGRIISLDHDPTYAQISSNELRKHNLERWVAVLFAPLTQVKLSRGEWPWYNIENLEKQLEGLSIDLLVIDGPPSFTHPLARYPALPLLSRFLSSKAVVILDDASRPDEEKIVQLWQQDFPGWTVEKAPCEKGAVILRRI